MKKTVLITGGLGFIGTNLIHALLRETNYSFIILDKVTYAGRIDNLPQKVKDRKRIQFVEGDIINKNIVLSVLKNTSMVIHLAANTHTARSLKDPLSFVKTNVLGTTQLLDVASKYPIQKFIYISSSEVYGDRKEKTPMDENHPLNPVTPYAVTKLAADRMAYSYYLTKKLPIVILRPFNTYGSYQHTEKMIPLFITRLLKNEPITLHHGGLQKRDWVFVEDHVRAIFLALITPIEKINGEIFNIGTGKATSTKTVAELIAKALNKNKNLVQVEKTSLPGTMSNVGVSKKAEKILGWKNEVSLEEGIAKTALWYKKNPDWWRNI